jgi:hypothetical protein
LDRQRAIALLREILEVTNQSDINPISLHQDSPDNFSMKLKVYADEQLRNNINPILAREKLEIKQENGTLIIYSREP